MEDGGGTRYGPGEPNSTRLIRARCVRSGTLAQALAILISDGLRGRNSAGGQLHGAPWAEVRSREMPVPGFLDALPATKYLLGRPKLLAPSVALGQLQKEGSKTKAADKHFVAVGVLLSTGTYRQYRVTTQTLSSVIWFATKHSDNFEK